MPALIQYDSPPSLPIPLLPSFFFYSFLTVGLAHLANSALGAGREMDPPPRGGNPSPFLPRSVDSGAGRPNWKEPACFLRPDRAGQKGRDQLAHLGRTRRAKRGGTNWAIWAGPGGPKGGGPTGQVARENRSQKSGAEALPTPLPAPPSEQ